MKDLKVFKKVFNFRDIIFLASIFIFAFLFFIIFPQQAQGQSPRPEFIEFSVIFSDSGGSELKECSYSVYKIDRRGRRIGPFIINTGIFLCSGNITEVSRYIPNKPGRYQVSTWTTDHANNERRTAFVFFIRGAVGEIVDIKDNQAPSAINLSVIQPDYCRFGPTGIFSWTFTDPNPRDTQSAYQVQVDNNSDFSSPEVDSGRVNSNSNSFATPSGKLIYNTTYFWRLMVWDNNNLASDWAAGPSFTTPAHQYPRVNFTWSPQHPTAKEPIQFTDLTICYDADGICNSWLWDFGDGNTTTIQNPVHSFLDHTEYTVRLTVTDEIGRAHV